MTSSLEIPEGTDIVFRTGPNTYAKYVPPTSKEELKRWFEFFFGLILVDKAYCDHHCAPLDAVASSYFNENPVNIFEGSRAYSGKSFSIAALAVSQLLLGADVTILAGSFQQSQRVHETEIGIWNRNLDLGNGLIAPSPLANFLAEEPTRSKTRLKNGATLTALTATQKSARGAHPQKLYFDEADEVDLSVFDAALGQPLSKNGIPAQVTIASTHQYPSGTFSEIKRRAAANNWGYWCWCYKDTLESNGGWLKQAEVDAKRLTITAEMWKTEYDLQEPSLEGRVFDGTHLLQTFSHKIGTFDGADGEYVEVRGEKPREDATYVTGVDWAKEKDYTVIVTFRVEDGQAKLVAFERRHHEPWPMLIECLNDRLRRYPGKTVHDAFGIGGVIGDYAEDDIIPFYASGKRRIDLYQGYIVALQKGRILSPYIKYLHDEHKFTTRKDLFDSNLGHVPDSVCAMALAWSAVTGLAEDSKKKKRTGGKLLPIKRF